MQLAFFVRRDTPWYQYRQRCWFGLSCKGPLAILQLAPEGCLLSLIIDLTCFLMFLPLWLVQQLGLGLWGLWKTLLVVRGQPQQRGRCVVSGRLRDGDGLVKGIGLFEVVSRGALKLFPARKGGWGYRLLVVIVCPEKECWFVAAEKCGNWVWKGGFW